MGFRQIGILAEPVQQHGMIEQMAEGLRRAHIRIAGDEHDGLCEQREQAFRDLAQKIRLHLDDGRTGNDRCNAGRDFNGNLGPVRIFDIAAIIDDDIRAFPDAFTVDQVKGEISRAVACSSAEV